MPGVKINEVLSSTYGWDPVNLERTPWLDGAVENFETFSPAGVFRTTRSQTYTNQELALPLQFYLPLDYAEDEREGAKDDLVRAMKGIPADRDTLRNPELLEGEVALQFGSSTRKRYAFFRGGPRFEWRVDPLLFGSGLATFDMAILDPGWYDAAETVAFPNSTPVFVDLGTLPSYWQMVVSGAATDPTVVVYAAPGGESGTPGDEIFRITTDFAVGGGETFTIDQLYHRLLHSASSPEDVTDEALPEGGGFFRQLEAQGSDEGVWVQLTSGTGVLHLRKVWR